MKSFFTLLMIITGIASYSQSTDEEDIKITINDFFKAFHSQDSIGLKNLAMPETTLNSVSINSEGKSDIKTQNYQEFVKAIIAIPSSTNFKEKIHSYDIKVNGMIANAITPYSFYVKNTLSHCGVNSFQLVKIDDKWKIIYIIDTRIKEGCVD